MPSWDFSKGTGGGRINATDAGSPPFFVTAESLSSNDPNVGFSPLVLGAVPEPSHDCLGGQRLDWLGGVRSSSPCGLRRKSLVSSTRLKRPPHTGRLFLFLCGRGLDVAILYAKKDLFMARQLSIGCLLILTWLRVAAGADEHFRLGVFDIDASPPVGSPLAYDPNIEVETPLSCRGIVLLPAVNGVAESDIARPIVLCAVDWIGIANGSHREFREVIAKAAGTTASRVAVHTLHQHDAPWCDFTTDEIVASHKIGYRPLDSAFARDLLRRLQPAVAKAASEAKPVTHVGVSTAEVKQVASNRRILGPDGKVAFVRYTATKDAKIREFPEGTIDPLLRMITFWNGDEPLAVLTYYATHPQSYYRTGKANPDFPGLRAMHESTRPACRTFTLTALAATLAQVNTMTGLRKTGQCLLAGWKTLCSGLGTPPRSRRLPPRICSGQPCRWHCRRRHILRKKRFRTSLRVGRYLISRRKRTEKRRQTDERPSKSALSRRRSWHGCVAVKRGKKLSWAAWRLAMREFYTCRESYLSNTSSKRNGCGRIVSLPWQPMATMVQHILGPRLLIAREVTRRNRTARLWRQRLKAF